jgi:AAA+ ATPase superfamily predicted ATPase
MKFYDRKQEIRTLLDIRRKTGKTAQFTLLTGRRRVGKTALLRNAFEKKDLLYLFVSRKSEPLLCAEFQQDAQDALGIQIHGRIPSFRELFEALLIHGRTRRFTLVIDEFQDFSRINPSVFSDMQDIWDRYKDTSAVNLIVCGSIYSLLTKIFEDGKEPLFGRLTAKMALRPFTPSVIKRILRDHNPDYSSEDLLCLYMLSGGIPKYIELLMDAGATDADGMIRCVSGSGSPFLSDGRDILISEFGKDYSTYFSILQLIASGKTSQSAVDSVIGKATGAYFANLETDYALIERHQPLFSKPGSRNIRWRIKDHYLNFWFRFIYANQTLVELQRFDLLRERIRYDYRQYSGLVLEDYFRLKLMEDGRYTAIGKFWDRKGVNEIDVIAVNDMDRKALVAEVKRNKSDIDLSVLSSKALSLSGELSGYDISYRAFSMENM